MFLKRLHPSLFGISLGFFGFSLTWKKFSQFSPEISNPLSIFSVYFALFVLIVVTVLWIAKFLLYREIVVDNFLHPVLGPLLALFPLSVLMGVKLLLPQYPDFLLAAEIITLCAIGFQFLIAWRTASLLANGKFPNDLVTPALYLPVVPGGLIGGIACMEIGYPGFGLLLWGTGAGGWVILEMRILGRLFHGPLPEPFRATIGIEMAPLAVGALTAVSLWPEMPIELLLVAIGMATAPIIGVLTRWKTWTKTPFTPSFWTFSFPLAAFASCILEAIHRGHWPIQVAYAIMAICCLIFTFLTARTLILLFKGKLV